MLKPFLGGDKADSGIGEGGQPFSLITPNSSALGPMIPTMVAKVIAITMVSVVSISFGVMLGYYVFLVLLASYLEDLPR